jgi:Concanavalin A-like lectin/glucanases superfamily
MKTKLSFLSLPAIAAKASAAAYSFLFPSGSASSIVETTDVTITPVKHWNSQWAWWCAKHNNLLGQQPSFLVPKANHYNLASGMHLAMFASAADSDTWTDFASLTIGATNIEFQHSSPFAAKKIYLAALPMYPFSRIQRKLADWTANSLVGETPSSTGNIVATTTAREAGDGSGRTVPALPIYAFKIANATPNTKNKIVIAAYNHPSETPGAFSMEGAIVWLLTSGVKQDFLLDWCEFYVYPCINPQGVWAGYFRSCPQGPTYDHNRKFNDGTSGVLEDVDAVKAAIVADCSDVEAFFDFHSYMDNSLRFGNVIDNTEPVHVAYKNLVNAYDAGFNIQNSAVTDGFKDWIAATFSPTLVLAPEHGHAASAGVTDYKAYGENLMQALADFLIAGRMTNGPGVGSRDFNGSSDRIDWANVYNPAGQALSISFWVNPDAVTANQYMLCFGKSDNTSGILVSLNTVPNLQFLRTGGTSLSRYGTNLGAGSWQHVLITHTGAHNDYTTIHIYVSGAEITYSGGTNGATEAAITGLWAIGGRPSDDLRNFNGKVAQVGVWNRVLNSTEIANLTAGYTPDLAAASGLQFYFKGNTSSLVASPGGTGTADGATQVTGVGNGPSIIY